MVGVGGVVVGLGNGRQRIKAPSHLIIAFSFFVVSMSRYARKAVTLSDGTHIPKGTVVQPTSHQRVWRVGTPILAIVSGVGHHY